MKTTSFRKIKFPVVCLTTWHTLKSFRSKRQYLSLAVEWRVLSERSLIGLILMAGVRSRHVPLRQTVKAVPKVSILEGVHCVSVLLSLESRTLKLDKTSTLFSVDLIAQLVVLRSGNPEMWLRVPPTFQFDFRSAELMRKYVRLQS